MTFETTFISNREVRRVPAGWQHPRDASGRYLPLHAWDYLLRMNEDEGEEIVESWAGRDLLMPEPGEDAQIMAYETTTEGTPCSLAFPDSPEGRLALVNWCAENVTTWADHKADAETWAAMLFGGGLAAVGQDGSVHFS
jgi:hypothetical protein